MSKRLAVLAVLFSLEFLSLGFLMRTAFPSRSLHVSPPGREVSQPGTRAVKLDLPPKNDAHVFFKEYGELPRRSENFPTAKEAADAFFPSLRVVLILFRVILAPKIPSYIFQSVLNL